jgi:signal transduction histidine kinase/DNA-binding response OmpR family regulator
MNELALSVNSTLDLDTIMKGLMKTLESLYPFESLYVISKLPDNRTYKIVGAYGSAVTDYEELTFKELELDIEQDANSVFVTGIEQNRIINIPRLKAAEIESSSELDKLLYNIKPSRSICYFPVQVGGQVIAGVAFINYQKSFDLKEADLTLISECLVQVGTAIKNVSMYEIAEQARKKAEESEQAKGRFLANMSHEIRTPMTAIIGYSEAMLDESLTKSNREKFANTIIRSSRHLLTVINDILDISKIESSKIDVETMDVEMATIISDLDDYVRQQTKEKGLSYQLQIQYPLPSVVQADPTRLKQILFNLTNNAVKFTKDGWVKIEISYAYEKMIFSVEDSGIGLDQEEKSRLFSAFTQADTSTTRLFGGSGLGLYISKNLAHLMGGELTVESEKGIGSCFTLIIGGGENASSSYIQTAGMLTQLMDEYKSQQKTQFIPKLTGKVLLAEDNPDNQLLVKRLINAAGVEVVIVDDGLQALDKIAKESFDLVLLDMQMPNMGGEEAAQKMRKKGIQTPLVAFTANVMKHQVDQYIENGFNQVVEKPISHDQLYTAMQLYLPAQEGIGSVLIVEDNLVNQQIMQRLVKKANPQVTILTADNGYEAIKVCEEHTVNLIFMDMEMPVMGGLEATEKLRALRVEAPIYMITGHVDTQHKQQSLDAGADGYLVKPVDKEHLYSLIHHIFS